MSLFEELAEFIGPTHQKKSITHKGSSRDFYFRELSADVAEELFGAVDKDPKKNKGLRNRILAKIVCNEDGSDALTEKEAGRLPIDLANKLQTAALEVNGLGAAAEEAAKNE
jgi:hypothetical protein